LNKRLLVFGDGLLGKAFEHYLPDNFSCKILSHSECDIMHIENVKKIISEFNPDFIINTAAITDVDYCEKHSQEAFIVNAGGAGYIASAARDRGIRFVHFSTDYVFDGTKKGEYSEEDEVNPLSEYAKSKYEGEQLVRFSGADYLIIRVQWLFGEFRDTFIDKAVKRLMSNERVDAIVDQYGSPTYVKYVVYATARLLSQNSRGIVHIASSDTCSRYEQMIFICNLLGLNKGLVNQRSWKDFEGSAPRPAKIELSKKRLFSLTGFQMPDWREQTEEYIKLRYGSKK